MKWIIIVSLLLVGCNSYNVKTEKWHGQPLDNVVLAWGPPTSQAVMDDGRKVVKFAHGDVLAYCSVIMRTDSQGVVMDSSWDGKASDCRGFFSSK